ncbi:hypothetical protein QQ045_019511 [Rhodiola kirilowii]
MCESTTLKCMKKWCEQIIELYKNDYLRSPNAADLCRLLRKAEQRGFPGMIHRLNVLKKIMLACIVMHNMIIEEEFVEEEFIEHEKEDLYNPFIAFTMYDEPIDPNGSRIHHGPVERAERSKAFHNRLVTLQSAYLHTQLQVTY